MVVEFGRWHYPERMARFNARIDTLLSVIPALPFDIDDAHAAARIDAALASEGNRIGPEEVLIAGTAVAKGFILVSSNTREFSRFDGLQFEVWRDSTFEILEPVVMYGSRVRPPLRTG